MIRKIIFNRFYPVGALLILFLAVWAPSPVTGEENLPRLESYLSKDNIHVGDPVTYYLKVTAPPDVRVDFTPLDQAGLEEIEVKKSGAGTKAPAGPNQLWRKWYLLTSFEVGSHRLPPAEARLYLPGGKEKILQSSPLSFQVESLLSPSSSPPDIRDIKAPLELKVSYLRLILMILAGLLVLALLYFLLRRFSRRPEKALPPPPPRPAAEIAYEELRRIKGEKLPARGRIKEYYSRISGVLRHYLENRFQLKAPERTTEEFLGELATTNILSLSHQELVGDFLAHCDLVKFARYGPTEKEIEGVYDSAVRLVDETKSAGESKTEPARKQEGKS